MPIQTAAELCILDFKTTWSEFKKPSQTLRLAQQKSDLASRTLNMMKLRSGMGRDGTGRRMTDDGRRKDGQT